MDNQTTDDLFTQLIQKAMETLGGAQAAFGPELHRQAADHGKRINRLAEKAMAALRQWAGSGSETAPDPEAAARLSTAMSELWLSFHSEYMGRYLNLPPLGVGRESSRKVLQAMEAHNRLWAGVTQFLNDFQRPLSQSLNRLPKVLADPDQPIETADHLYRVMRTVFDEQYHAYLASPEGVGQVSALVDCYLEFKKQFDAAVAPALKYYGLATKEEMADVYSRLHRLKKLQREYQTRLTRQEAAIEALRQQVDTLQSAAHAGQKPVKTRKPAPAAKRTSPARKKAPVTGA